jgi:hypothetical protein
VGHQLGRLDPPLLGRFSSVRPDPPVGDGREPGRWDLGVPMSHRYPEAPRAAARRGCTEGSGGGVARLWIPVARAGRHEIHQICLYCRL